MLMIRDNNANIQHWESLRPNYLKVERLKKITKSRFKSIRSETRASKTHIRCGAFV